jgi:RHS repeat-associated protein
MKRYVSVIISALLFCGTAFSQTGNWIRTTKYLSDADTSKNYRDITYYDGLGYPEQVIQVKGSPDMKNIVKPIVYDNMRRSDAKVYLPYVSANNTAMKETNPLQAQVAFYQNRFGAADGQYAYVENIYEASPLNRILQTYNAGSIYRAADKKSVNAYQANSANEVLYLTVNMQDYSLVINGYYAANALYKNSTVNEDGATVYTYTDKLGRTVLTRSITDSAVNVDTYYVYNDFGQQAWVVQPEGSAYLYYGYVNQISIAHNVAEKYCFIYKYDWCGNIIERKLPGKTVEYMVYDKGDRLVLFQDGNMRENNQWLYSVYDNVNNITDKTLIYNTRNYTPEQFREMYYADSYCNDYVTLGNSHKIEDPFGGNLFDITKQPRSIYRARYYGKMYFGNYVSSSSDKYLKINGSVPANCSSCEACDMANDYIDSTGNIRFEYYYGNDNTNASIKYYRLPAGYLSVAQCMVSAAVSGRYEILSSVPVVNQGSPWVTPSHLAFEPVNDICTYDDLETEKIKNLKAYERLRVLDDSGVYVERAFYYDSKGRLIQTVEKNHLGGTSRYSTKYDFTGNVLAQHEKHETFVPRTGGSGSTVGEISKKIIRVSEFNEKLTLFTYDERGRLLSEKTTVNDSDTAKVEYKYNELGQQIAKLYDNNLIADSVKYNIQGWITEKNAKTGTDGIFDMQLAYYSPEQPNTTPSYTGNISEWTWRHENSDVNTYSFEYDKLSRLTNSLLYIDNTLTNTFTQQDIVYDRNGNIFAMKHYDAAGINLNGDNSYMYNGNQFIAIRPGMLAIMHRLYNYDANGNMSRDFRKNMDVQYNILNLPYMLKFPLIIGSIDLSESITYRYLADGTKAAVKADTIRGIDSDGNIIDKEHFAILSYGYDYLGSFVYSRDNDTLTFESTSFAGGRINKTNSAYDINYFITDHLGSTRVIVDNSGVIKEQKDYYPFGKEHENPNLITSTNRWGFSGKEKQTVKDLGYLDFGARMLSNSEIPLFTTQDPLAEKYYSVSPYAYCGNNPVNRIDPNGMEWLNKRDEEIAKRLQQEIANRDKSLAKQEQKINTQIEKITNNSKWSDEKKNKEVAKQQEKLDNVQEQRTHLSALNDGITQLGSSKTIYTFNTVKEGTTALLSSNSDGTIVINNYGTAGNRAHETTHAIQYDNDEISFSPLGSNNVKFHSDYRVLELQAYRTEYSITNGIVPSSDAKYPRTIFGITLQWLYKLKDINTGTYRYKPENYK